MASVIIASVCVLWAFFVVVWLALWEMEGMRDACRDGCYMIREHGEWKCLRCQSPCNKINEAPRPADPQKPIDLVRRATGWSLDGTVSCPVPSACKMTDLYGDHLHRLPHMGPVIIRK